MDSDTRYELEKTILQNNYQASLDATKFASRPDNKPKKIEKIKV